MLSSCNVSSPVAQMVQMGRYISTRNESFDDREVTREPHTGFTAIFVKREGTTRAYLLSTAITLSQQILRTALFVERFTLLRSVITSRCGKAVTWVHGFALRLDLADSHWSHRGPSRHAQLRCVLTFWYA
jgi:hypothetical protein